MRKALTVFAIALSIAIAGAVNAQVPYVQIYFDQNFSQTGVPCPTEPVGTVQSTLYVVGHNFNCWIMAAEFAIDYSTKLTWEGDFFDTDLHLGNSPTGVAIVWSLPKNAFGASLLMWAGVTWECDTCEGNENTPVVVMPFPDSGLVRAIRYPDEAVITAVGMTSLICPTVPTNETTWGKVKALYN